MVQMRDYSSRREWVRGRITNKIGNKMYEVRSGGKLYIQHIELVANLRKMSIKMMIGISILNLPFVIMRIAVDTYNEFEVQGSVME